MRTELRACVISEKSKTWIQSAEAPFGPRAFVQDCFFSQAQVCSHCVSIFSGSLHIETVRRPTRTWLVVCPLPRRTHTTRRQSHPPTRHASQMRQATAARTARIWAARDIRTRRIGIPANSQRGPASVACGIPTCPCNHKNTTSGPTRGEVYVGDMWADGRGTNEAASLLPPRNNKRNERAPHHSCTTRPIEPMGQHRAVAPEVIADEVTSCRL